MARICGGRFVTSHKLDGQGARHKILSLSSNTKTPCCDTGLSCIHYSKSSVESCCLLTKRRGHVSDGLFFFKQKTAYEITRWLEFRRVLFRSSIFRNWFATVCNPMLQRFHIYKLICNCLQPHIPTVPYSETDLQLFATPCSNGSIFRNWVAISLFLQSRADMFQRFHI